MFVLIMVALYLYVYVSNKHKEFRKKEEEVKANAIIDYDHTLWDYVFEAIENQATRLRGNKRR